MAEEAHLPAMVHLQSEGLIELVGLSDLDQTRARIWAQRFGVIHHGSDWPGLVEKTGAEAVVVCLPPGPNAEVSIRALEMGRHVLCELIPGQQMSQGDRMAEQAASQSRLITMLALNRRFAPAFAKVRSHTRPYGSPRALQARIEVPAVLVRAGQAVLLSREVAQALDMAMDIMGMPYEIVVQAAGAGLNVPGGGPAFASLRLNSVCGSAVLLFQISGGGRMEQYQWANVDYQASFDFPGRAEWSRQGQLMQKWNAAERPGMRLEQRGYLGLYQSFAGAIAGQGPRPVNDFAYAKVFTQVMERVVEGMQAIPAHAPAGMAPH